MNNLFANIILFDTSGIAYTGDDLIGIFDNEIKKENEND